MGGGSRDRRKRRDRSYSSLCSLRSLAAKPLFRGPLSRRGQGGSGGKEGRREHQGHLGGRGGYELRAANLGYSRLPEGMPGLFPRHAPNMRWAGGERNRVPCGKLPREGLAAKERTERKRGSEVHLLRSKAGPKKERSPGPLPLCVLCALSRQNPLSRQPHKPTVAKCRRAAGRVSVALLETV